MTLKTQAQSWLDTNLYPFESRYVDLKAGSMHYVDEGSGEVILFVHGTPTWSFLYRDFVRELSSDYRCIAIDHLGFGLSSKPDTFPGTPEWHAENLSEFIQKLDLRNITLVVHDFGGPIGLAAGIKNSGRVKRVVLFNSWLWATKDNPDVQKIDKTVNRWLGKFLYLNLNISPKVLLRKGFSDKKNLTKAVHRHYINPFTDKDSRYSLLYLARALKGSSDWYTEQWQQIEKLSDKDWLILWGMEDEFFPPEYIQRWKSKLPAAHIKKLACGHFVQEEETREAIRMVSNFMLTKNLQAANPDE